MIKIERSYPTAVLVEAGDIFYVEGTETYLQLLELGDKFALLDLSTSSITSSSINCEIHAINHVKKHYGEYELIKSSRVTFKIQD
ncbi:hypothetical protein ACW5UC_24580 [Priestia aryabhattai]|uniref:hypothetical protein n=1 Tax=Priestia megaterium TaxID=1404 RepID=UPI003F9887CF